MKLAFIVENDHFSDRVMETLRAAGIDYYTRWDKATGKGHGTEPHLGRGGFPATNAVFMIAFEEEPPLVDLIERIVAANAGIKRADDKIRLFQVPLERVV